MFSLYYDYNSPIIIYEKIIPIKASTWWLGLKNIQKNANKQQYVSNLFIYLTDISYVESQNIMDYKRDNI